MHLTNFFHILNTGFYDQLVVHLQQGGVVDYKPSDLIVVGRDAVQLINEESCSSVSNDLTMLMF